MQKSDLKRRKLKRRKTRSDKFPLTLHKTGQFCKKIKGKLCYFGTDKKLALKRYLEQASYLHKGKAIPPDKKDNDLSIRYLCNLYLEHQQSKAETGQIKMRHIYDQTLLLRDFVRFIGPNRIITDISTMDIQNYNHSQTCRQTAWPKQPSGKFVRDEYDKDRRWHSKSPLAQS